ncbi:MAG: hypothetical protein ACLQG3_10175 [Terracidiphilus sp.]
MEFLCTKKAYLAFLWCAWIVIALIAYLLFEFTPLFPNTTGFSVYGAISFGLGVLLNTIDVPAAFIIWLGMGIHCVWFYRPRIAAKIAWIALIVVTVCFGATLYFFVVYRKQMIDKSVRA